MMSKSTLRSRGFWLRQMRQWHWISAAISLVGMILFALTGITLNHASLIEAKPQVTAVSKTLPGDLLQQTNPGVASVSKGSLPGAIADWISREMAVDVAGQPAEWSNREAYVSLPRPGGDAWLTLDLSSGEIQYEKTDRGWIAYLNDLHKGRNAGAIWSLYLDLFAAACIVFCATGLVLLQLMAANRPSTWPLIGVGLVLPALVAVFLIH